MNIVHLAKYYHPYKGGMETVVQNLCNGCSSKHHVKVICANDKPEALNETIERVEVQRLANYGVLASQPLVPSALHALGELDQADVVHLHVPNPLFEFSSLLRISSSMPLVATHHSDIVKQRLLGKLYHPFLKKFYERVDKIIVPTKNHISSSEILPQFSEKIEIIPFGLDLSLYPNDEKVLKISQNYQEKHSKYFVFIGRLVGYKGLKYLIEAFKNIDAKLLICGSGMLEQELKILAKELGVSHKIEFLGRVDGQENLGGLIKGSLGLVLPSISNNENFGMVQLEAMVYKVPVVATNLSSGASTIVEEGKTGFLVSPESSAELSEALSKILAYPAKSVDMGVAGHQRLLDHYTFEKMINSHLEVYSSLL